MMKKKLHMMTWTIAFLFGSVTQATLFTIDADPNDARVRNDGDVQWVGQNNIRLGTETAGTYNGFVIPFLMPDLNGQPIQDVTLQIYNEVVSNSKQPQGLDVAIDLYGVRVNSSSTVLASDFKGGSVVYDSALPDIYAVGVGTQSLSSTGMATWLQNNYSVGDYAFFSIVPKIPNDQGFAYLTITSANGATEANRPVLEINVIPEPGTLALVGVALGALLVFRRRK